MSKGRAYTVLIKRSAEKEMDRLPASTFKRVARAILKLEREPRTKGSKKLCGMQDYRLRVGDGLFMYERVSPCRTPLFWA